MADKKKDNMIGGHQFAAIVGVWSIPKLEKVINVRPGTEGAAIIQIGVHPTPFRLQTFTDTKDLSACHKTYKKYIEQITKDPVPLVLAGQRLEDHGYWVDVLSVDMVSASKTGESVGGLVDESKGLLVCSWTLMPIKIAGKPDRKLDDFDRKLIALGIFE